MNHFMIYENQAAITTPTLAYGVMEEEAFKDKAILNLIKKFSFHHEVQDYPQGSASFLLEFDCWAIACLNQP